MGWSGWSFRRWIGFFGVIFILGSKLYGSYLFLFVFRKIEDLGENVVICIVFGAKYIQEWNSMMGINADSIYYIINLKQ